MGVSNVPRVQSVDGEQLYTGMKLSEMLKGAPLTKRPEADPEAALHALNAALTRALETLEAEMGMLDATAGAALEQTKIEWQAIIDMPLDYAGIACKRAALLFALHHEPLLRAPFATAEPALVADLADRVLPLVVPPFVAGMAQNPDALVIAALSLLESFPGESLGLPVA
ncbi:MAG: hypothetical protein CMM02_05210 [Rhodopirellula sp.]|nr:hypothetical protein [Rhodopirellula sp.]